MKKLTALLLALVMVLALCACGGGNTEPAVTPDEPPAANEPAPAPAAETGDDFEEYKTYVAAYAAAGAPTEEEGQTVVAAITASATVEELEAVPQLTVLFENGIVLSYADWVAAGKPAADTEGMGIDPNAGSGEATGEASGEPTEEPADAAAPAGGEASEEPTGEPVAELYPADGFDKTLDGYKAYAEEALRQDEHAPAEIVETTAENIRAAASGDDDAFAMLVRQGLILSYADFIA